MTRPKRGHPFLDACYWAIFLPLAVVVCYWRFFLLVLVALLGILAGVMVCGGRAL